MEQPYAERTYKSTDFKGIKSTFTLNGKKIVSGQKVMCHGRMNKSELCEVFFNRDFGFRVQGNNMSDAYITEIVHEPNIITCILGNLKLLYYNILR